jgi:hypothetical protein
MTEQSTARLYCHMCGWTTHLATAIGCPYCGQETISREDPRNDPYWQPAPKRVQLRKALIRAQSPRERVAALLSEMGLEVWPEDIEPAGGRWRNKTCDGCDGTRWWATGTARGIADLPAGLGIMIHGYDTLTDCARRGVVLTHDWTGPHGDVVGHYDAWAA